MSFIPDKSEIFSEISSIKALQDGLPELNKLFNSFDSVKSKSGDLIPLMLDLLKTLLGDQIKETFKELLKETDKIESKIKKTIIKTTLKQVSKKTDFKLSQIQNPILNINIKNIDIEGTLKVDPNTDLGKFYYGKAAPLANVPNDPSIQVAVEPGGDFTKFLFDVKQNGEGNWKNIVQVDWPNGQNELKVSIGPSYLAGKSFEDFLTDFLDSVKILDLSVLFSTILDTLFGAISSLVDTGAEWLENKIKLKVLVDKIIEEEAFADSQTPTKYNNDFFLFNKEETDFINFKTTSIANGDNLQNLGCGYLATNIDLRDFEDGFNLLNNSRPSLIKEGLNNVTDNILKKSVAGANDNDKKNIENNILKEIFENLTAIIFSQTIKPFNVILQQMGESIMNTTGIDPDGFDPSGNIGAPGLQIESDSLNKSAVEDYTQKFQNLNTCIIKEIYSAIVEFLFDIVKAEALKLVRVKIELILQDQFKNYKEQIESAREVLKNVTNILSFINNLSG
tara:strand:- start:596 stop:2116 length:1521 start_codon:yes stop_codon:yes gene_type:complete